MHDTSGKLVAQLLGRLQKQADDMGLDAAVNGQQEEGRKQDIHDQQLQFNDDKHQLEMQQLQLNLQQAQESFQLKQQQQMQKAEEAAAAKQEAAVQQQQEQQSQQAEMQQQSQVQQHDTQRQNIMAKAAAIYSDEIEPIDFRGAAPSLALGAGMGGAAGHYLFPTEATKKYREMAKAITPEQIKDSLLLAKRKSGKMPAEVMEMVSDVGPKGDKIKFKAPAHVRSRFFKNRAFQANAGRLLKGTGAGLLAGLIAHKAME